MASTDSAERTVTNEGQAERTGFLVWLFAFVGVVALFFGVLSLLNSTLRFLDDEARIAAALGSIALLPSACLLFLAAVHLWAHRKS